MRRFRTKPVIIKAVQITAETFTDSHPNAELIIGVIYDPRQRCALISTSLGMRRVEIGEWIIRDADGFLHAWKDAAFRATYEPEEGDYSRRPAPPVTPARRAQR